MGCVQTKPSLSSPERCRMEKLMADHGYTGGSTRGRRSMGPPPVVREDEGEGGGARRAPSPAEIERKIEDDMVDGWPRWLVNNIPKEVLDCLVPKSADSYVMIGKVGQGTYSNVYKARDRETGNIVALKKVRFDTSESESVRFMAREITILQRLDHPNVLKLEGIATSRMQYSLYLVFEFMQSDLARVISRPGERLTESQIKCYMHQILSGLQHCHERGILHRDIKGSNLLIDKHGVLKVGDFGLANYFSPNQKRPLTSRVVTLWYRAPELLLGSTDYGVGIDLWSAGCLLAEMFAGRPIMPGRTEIEQLHRIFRLCGSPSEEYWRKLKLSTSFRPPQPYDSNILETFRNFPSSSLGLLSTLLSLDPSSRGSAASALKSEFFGMCPLACSLSDLPVVYSEESDDSVQPHERKKKKSSKLKKQRQSQLETRVKLEQEEDLPKADSHSSIEDDKFEDLIIHSFILSSSTASSSSSSKTDKYAFTSSQSPSPTTSTLSKQSPSTTNINSIMNTPSTRTEYHPLAAKNIMNLLPHPALKISNFGSTEEELDLMRRSTSMPDIGRLARDLLYEHYGLGE